MCFEKEGKLCDCVVIVQKKGDNSKCDICALKDAIRGLKTKENEAPTINQYYLVISMAIVVLGLIFQWLLQ